jgi:hypothetical protein
MYSIREPLQVRALSKDPRNTGCVFPIRKRAKCEHIVTKYLDKLDEDSDAPDTSDDVSDTPDDASEDTSDNLV